MLGMEERKQMSAITPRYLIENHGPDQDAINTAFAEAFQICTQKAISNITLLVPAKGTFQDTVVGTFLGDKVTKALCKGQIVRITDDLTMNLESPKTISPYGSYGMVIGVYLTQKDQNVLDSLTSVKAIVLLPWTEDEGKSWLSTWNATILGNSSWQVQQTTLPTDVEADLLRLTQGINLSTGLSHPSDKESAKRILAAIKERGHRLNPDDIRKWALRNNWQPRNAEDLAKLAGRCFK
jgi:hypothetical protein